MKLTEKDLQDACMHIMHEILKDRYGDDYKEKGITFDLNRINTTVREIVDEFIVWLKIKIKEEKNMK